MRSPIFTIVFSYLLFTAHFGNAQSTNEKPNFAGMNPDISANVLMLGRTGNKGNDRNSEAPNGFRFREAELRLASNIDAYFRGDVVLSVEKEDGEYKLEPEELVVETLSVPDVTIRAGKLYALIGRHNTLHTHAFPFIDAPLTNTSILGEEGLNESGVSAAYLAPTPWFLELVAHAFSAENETLFGSGAQDDMTGTLFIKNLWDLSPSATLEMDLAYGGGGNSFGGNTQVYSASMTYKWRPVEKSTERSLLATVEYLQSDRGGRTIDDRVGGLSSWIQWQFKRRWWLQAREEYLGLPAPDAGITRKHSGLIGFYPSEFSDLKLQYDNIDYPGDESVENRISIQLNVSIGAHPAHSY